MQNLLAVVSNEGLQTIAVTLNSTNTRATSCRDAMMNRICLFIDGVTPTN